MSAHGPDLRRHRRSGGSAGKSFSSSYALNGLDHINYYNGMMNVAIPLVTIGGRGEASRAITIPIQRQWEVTNVDGVYRLTADKSRIWPALHFRVYFYSIGVQRFLCLLLKRPLGRGTRG